MSKKLSWRKLLGLVIIILCLAAVALASSYNTVPEVIEDVGTSVKVDMTTDLSGVKLIPEREKRLQAIPNAPRAKTNR